MKSSVLAMPSQTGRSSSGSSHQFRSSAITVSPPATALLVRSSGDRDGPGAAVPGREGGAVRFDEHLLIEQHAAGAALKRRPTPIVIARNEQLARAGGAELLQEDRLAARARAARVLQSGRVEVVAQEDHRGALGVRIAPFA